MAARLKRNKCGEAGLWERINLSCTPHQGACAVADLGEWPENLAPSLLLGQTEAIRVKNNYSGDRSHPYHRN